MVIEHAAGGFDSDDERSRRQREVAELLARLEANPNPALYVRAAELLSVDGDTTEATRVCEEGLRRFPSYVNLYVVKGELAASSGQMQVARELFQRAVELDEFNFDALTRLADACMELRDYDGAAAVGRTILGWLPGDGTGKQILRRAEEAAGREGTGQG